ncbi:hypothetical protein [Amycolatopsis sp.]|uniref:hypothetical protein n=1 Tax=Amycolatopsis sp. TaxID=37632 RepID=UPI002DFD9F00|nr:hypothetical protein [Amycolatopsis sp.]
MESRTTAAKTAGIALVAAGLGIIVQILGGAEEYPDIPPGAITLVVAGLAVFAWRSRWSPAIAVIVAGFILIGAFLTGGTGDRLSAPGNLGQFLGTVLQMAGVVVALGAGIAGLVKAGARPRVRK